MKAVVLLSGGIDSTVLAYWLRQDQGFHDLHCLTFDYGQRHDREIEHAEYIADGLGADWDRVDLSDVGRLMSGSALTDDEDLPEGHYTDDKQSDTVVPNRNAVFLSIAFAAASAGGAELVAAAMQAGGGDSMYPDARPEFAAAFDDMERIALDPEVYGQVRPRLAVPFIGYTKAEIIKTGQWVDVPWEATWTCFRGQDRACGRCGACVKRLEGFNEAGVEDPVEYVDREYWRTQVDG